MALGLSNAQWQRRHSDTYAALAQRQRTARLSACANAAHPTAFPIQALFLDPSVQKSLTPAEASNVLAETRNVPHVKNALFNYTTHEARQ